MSDGPHRSLPMAKAWKDLAKKGDQRAYDANDVRDAAIYALSRDWTNEVSGKLLRALRDVFDGINNSLHIRELALAQLDAARHLAAGSVFGSSAVAWAELYIRGDAYGRDSFHEVIGSAVKERGYAGQRQVQEHYLRESSARRADSVAGRIGTAIDGLIAGDVGRMIAGDGMRAPQKARGLDDGVAFK